MRDNIARHMNTVNKNSVHKDLRRSFLLDDEEAIVEGLFEHQIQDKEKDNDNPLVTEVT